MRRDRARIDKLRIAVRYLVSKEALERGHQSRLAEHFDVSRQHVHQLVNEEKARRQVPIAPPRAMRDLPSAAASD